jgi:LacI family repressor for deo operon, udp, cdd, tsx, nupC, and nupG
MSKRPTTIATVARAAGVGVSTVSRVLNGGYVSDALERKVRSAMKRLDYTPSIAARNLKLNRSGIVGLVAPSSQAPFIGLFLSGVETALARHESSVALASLEVDGRYSTDTVQRWLEERRVDSLILVRATEREQELVTAVLRAAVPHVHVVPDRTWSGAPTLHADNVQAGRLAASHLLELGHTELAFFGGPATSMDTLDRLAGVRAALAERGRTLAEARTSFQTDYVVESGVEAAEHYLAGKLGDVTGVILGNDAMALGFLRTVLAAGRRVPDELSVVGFDDVPAASLVWPGLTTVSQPVRQMGEDAAALVARREPALSEELDLPPYPTRLVVRQSTGPAATR